MGDKKWLEATGGKVEEPRQRQHPSHKLIGLESTLRKIHDYLEGPDSPIVGIVGPGGIGKTALLNEIEQRFQSSQSSQFTKVIRVDVGTQKDMQLNVLRIQEMIAANLEPHEQDFDGLGSDRRAKYLLAALSKGKFLILLDDVWDELKFKDIGIPCSHSKIVYTTRLKNIRLCLESVEIVEMGYLNTDKSLELFRAVCANAESRDDRMARKIVGKCDGLPLALVTIGRAAVHKSLDYVDNALSTDPTKIEAMEKDILEVLKLSFDKLSDVDIHRPCFLFCVLLGREEVCKQKLINYWIAEELLGDDHGNLESLRTKGNDIVEGLLNACLLEQGRDNHHVRVHGIVHLMAAWLVTGRGGHKQEFIFYPGKEPPDILNKMNDIQRAYIPDADIGRLTMLQVDCPRLTTLLLGQCERKSEEQSRSLGSSTLTERDQASNFRRNHQIPDDFFGRRPALKILDITRQPIPYLPKSICDLVSLQYLDLSYTFIEKIPSGLSRLINLRHLDLSFTAFLSSIPKEAISSLSCLRSFKLYDSRYTGTNEKGQICFSDLDEMEKLAEVEVPLRDLEAVKIMLDYKQLVKRVTYLQLAFIADDESKRPFKIVKKFDALRTLSIRSCQLAEDVQIDNSGCPLESLMLQEVHGMSKITVSSEDMSCWSSHLTKLHISWCSELEDLTCLYQFCNLQVLEVEECDMIVNLVDSSHLEESESTENKDNIKDFSKCFENLKSLKLDNLPELTAVSNGKLQLRYLETVFVHGCPKLKKLPVTLDVPLKHKVKISCEAEWWQELEWEDDEAKLIFDNDQSNAEPTTEIMDSIVEDEIAEVFGIRDKVAEVMTYLKGDEHSVIGIVGAAGIGKTTLLLEVEKNAKLSGDFGNVIYVDVRHVLPYTRQGRIQDNHACRSVPDTSDQASRYILEQVHDSEGEGVNEKPCLLLLDSVQFKLNVHKIGLPKEKRWKTVLVARRESNCHEKTGTKVMKMEYLDKSSSWQLFVKSAGDIEGNKEIEKVAMQIVERCGGLPLALTVVGRAARHWKTPEQWASALDTLTNFPVDIQGMKERVFDVLMSSFNSSFNSSFKYRIWTPEEQKNALFCLSFQNHMKINKDQLVDCLIGEGKHLKGSQTDIKDRHRYIMGYLADVFLLEESVGGTITMHNVVWSMTRWLAESEEITFAIDDGLEDVNSLVKKMTTACRASIKANRIQELTPFDCPKLTTLVFDSPPYCDSTKCSHIVIRDDCFRGTMPKLAVLDMTRLPILHLPQSVCTLNSLRYLNLSWTPIKELPKEMGEIKNLSILNLNFMENLRYIPRDTIGSLTNLKSLRLYCAGYRDFGATKQVTWKELSGLSYLSELELPLISKYWRDDHQGPSVKLLKRLSLHAIAWLNNKELSSLVSELTGLQTLCIKSCPQLDGTLTLDAKYLDVLILCALPISTVILRQSQVREFHIYKCAELHDLRSLRLLQKLQIFGLYNCPSVTRLLQQSQDHMKCLPQLKHMILQNLPALESISVSPLVLGSLEHLWVIKCPKLREIPVIFPRMGGSIKIHCAKGWWKKWDIDGTKQAFTPELEQVVTKVKDRDELLQLEVFPDKQVNEDPSTQPKMNVFGMKSTISKILQWLREGSYRVIGIVGPAGIGKTTLLLEIQNSVIRSHAFSEVILVSASNNLDTQEQIANHLVDVDHEKFYRSDYHQRALILRAVLQRTCCLLLLDDVCDGLDFVEIGIPKYGDYKLVFASRCKYVSGMDRAKIVPIGYLDQGSSWQLFLETAGATAKKALTEDTEICNVAREMVERCGGLPRALCVVGKAARENWESARQALSRSPTDIPGMDESLIGPLRVIIDKLSTTTQKKRGY